MKINERIPAGDFYLRIPTLRDAEVIHRTTRISFDDLRPWMFWAKRNAPISDVQQFIRKSHIGRRKGTDFVFAIFDAATDEHLGMTGLHQIDPLHGFGELGYWVRTDRHRRGIAFAASVALLRFAFETKKLHKVKVRANVENKRSLKLIRKLGFVKEGISRDDLKVDGQWGDHIYFSMLEDEYRRYRSEFNKRVPRKITV